MLAKFKSKCGRVIGIFLLALLIVPTLPTSHAQEPEPIVIKVWLADTLVPPLEAQDLLVNEFAKFQDTSGVLVEVRLRLYVEGEYPQQLALIQQVAPDALPDLVLVRRQDLVDLARSGLLIPIAEWLPSSLINLPENQRNLGTVDDILYGYPYLLEVNHIVYPPDEIETPPRTFEEVLEREVQLLFPGAPLEGQVISDYLLTQYVAAGGSFATENGTPALDEDILRQLLEFYAAARDANLFNTCVTDDEMCLLTYDNPRDYWTTINNNTPVMAVMNAHLFLQQDTRFANFTLAAMPTLYGNATSLLDGWMWAVLTTDSLRQAEALQVFQWAISTDEMLILSDALHMLPSQENALHILENDEQMNLLGVLLSESIFVGEEERRGIAALALQNAFEAVLGGADVADTLAETMDTLETEE